MGQASGTPTREAWGLTSWGAMEGWGGQELSSNGVSAKTAGLPVRHSGAGTPCRPAPHRTGCFRAYITLFLPVAARER